MVALELWRAVSNWNDLGLGDFGLHYDCELPRIRRAMEDPEEFLKSMNGKRIVLDEIHRLENPSELLKIAADHYPKIRIPATGSSTLGASAKFTDTLTGRKRELWLTPIISEELSHFGFDGLTERLLRGGLPPFLMSQKIPEADFQEWVDAYWAKDIQELFRLERRHSFQKFFELLMTQSGGIFEANRLAKPCEVSRTTIHNYLKVLESTHVAHVIRPFNTHRATEIVAAPKVYAFDTGFFCYYSGWTTLRPADMGHLWEHFVLNQMQAHLQTRDINYWRDKQGHEIDFVIPRRGKAPIAIECKWTSGDIDEKNIKAFLKIYPQSDIFIVSHDAQKTIHRKIGSHKITCLDLSLLLTHIKGSKPPLRPSGPFRR